MPNVEEKIVLLKHFSIFHILLLERSHGCEFNLHVRQFTKYK